MTTDPPTTAAAASESLSPTAIQSLSWLSPLAPEAILEAFSAASRKGNLAGFKVLPSSPDQGGQGEQASSTRRCACDIFGSPYDRQLLVTIEPATGSDQPGSVLRFDTKLRKAFPIVVIVVMALAIWPGVWLTDSLLVTYFSWYPKASWVTPAWYLPLMILSVPVLIGQFRKSEAQAAEHAATLMAKLRKLAGAPRPPAA